ncbi:class I SAM-dependent methyltransferase [bacterium]|nr:class I SAM-dependent methyltransferase [bacterium]
MFDEKRFDAAGEQVEKLLSLAGVHSGSVLDLCCGPGRHSVALAQRGFRVTAVDRTAFLLGKARQRARKAGVKMEFVHSDMRDFVRPGAFDLAMNLFTSFGYFDNKDDDRTVLRHLHESLRSGGVVVMDMVGKEWLAKVMQATTSTEYPDGALLVQRHEVFDDWTRIRNEWILIKGETVRRFKFHHTLYSAQELRDRLVEAGFTDIRMCNSFDGAPYDGTGRLVAVARKR